jgi:hypothetical protein
VPEPIQTSLWPGGWRLVGNGPSYLLFRHSKMEVTHLASGLHRELHQSLARYRAIRGGELEPLADALILASAEAIYDADERANAPGRKQAAFVVMREIERLIRLFPERDTFEKELRRLCSSLRAAGHYAMYHTAPGAPESESPPGSFFARDRYGQRLLFTSNPQAVYRCEPDSPFAKCAQELWRKEQARSQRVVPYRVPTRKELREHLGTAEPAITICAGKKAFGRCRGLHGESESGTLRATWRPREIENALFGGVFI